MIVIVAAFVGVTLGVLSAKRRKGNAADMAQYGAVYGIAFSIVAVMITIAIDRMVL